MPFAQTYKIPVRKRFLKYAPIQNNWNIYAFFRASGSFKTYFGSNFLIGCHFVQFTTNWELSFLEITRVSSVRVPEKLLDTRSSSRVKNTREIWKP
jgi:hypothetical protein